MRFKLILAVLLIALGFATERLVPPPPEPEAAILTAVSEIPDGFVLVAKAVDGDTLQLADGSMVRYIGIDTPETVHPKKPVQCFGKEASVFNRGLVEGKPVRLVKDISDTDTYDRLLRYIYLEDGTFVNLALVAQGYATVNTYPPDTAHAAEFQAAQAQARAAAVGLWSACR